MTAQHLRRHCSICAEGGFVLDLAGGTGTARQYLPECRYICLDNEMPKLDGFRTKHPGGMAILGDCTTVPLPDGCMDAVLCFAMAHHLSDPQLMLFWQEARRVLRPEGHFLFVDPVWTPRWMSRILWSLDRGEHPRSAAELIRHAETHFHLTHQERFTVRHEYLMLSGHPRTALRRSA